nr:MAG TPA: hypothetical protein [Caudoviricetes sp.]
MYHVRMYVVVRVHKSYGFQSILTLPKRLAEAGLFYYAKKGGNNGINN